MQLHPVKTGFDGVQRSRDELLDHHRQLIGGQGAGHRVRLLARGRTDLAFDGYCAGPDDGFATGDVRVGYPAAVHDLREHPAALSVDGGGDLVPAGDLLLGDDAGLAGVGRARLARGRSPR